MYSSLARSISLTLIFFLYVAIFLVMSIWLIDFVSCVLKSRIWWWVQKSSLKLYWLRNCTICCIWSVNNEQNKRSYDLLFRYDIASSQSFKSAIVVFLQTTYLNISKKRSRLWRRSRLRRDYLIRRTIDWDLSSTFCRKMSIHRIEHTESLYETSWTTTIFSRSHSFCFSFEKCLYCFASVDLVWMMWFVNISSAHTCRFARL